ncbi:transporter substrate-binding domain-containing protein [Sulfurospirillum sp. hDNRA2]|uniref:transporter substrate-binding domain-containing protein n=1 Tax=Sulfurospirillum sp. hDNRA2 TaxID=3237298 RepID=UPI0020B74114|nr:transporter substrate-binding domain-containing protein [Sulfurospirillum sp. DNRA8]MCP3651087.1 transporter substrate-binding domain-containing protein [Sulfurospirillum sp. DNRA8]MCR1809933.1 transporter substrate-binding domain-containing protein [Sulfurospirillum sp. DNRA8]
MRFLVFSLLLFSLYVHASEVALSQEEQRYIEAHPIVRVHNEMDWAPFNFYEDGRAQGLSIDVMNLIAQKVGLKVAYITGYSWNEFLTMMQENRLDVMLNIVKNDDRENYLLFTTPYQSVAHCVVVRNDAPWKIETIHDILDKNIAIEEGFFNHHYLKEHYPNTRLTLKKDTLSTLQSIAYNETDLTVGLVPVETYMIKRYGLSNLKVIGISDEELFAPKDLRIATSIHNPILIGILQKGLDAIDQEERNRIVNLWVNTNVEKIMNWNLLFKILFFFLLILAGTLFWTWRVKRIQKELADSNFLMHNLLNAIPNPLFYKDANGVFLGFNQAYEEAFGIDSTRFIGKTVLELDYLPPEDRLKYHQEDMRVIQHTLSLKREQDMVFHDGAVHHTLYSVNGFKTLKGKPGGLIGIFADISHQKKIQHELEISRHEVEESHKAMKDSIEYASLIQHSLLPNHTLLHRFFSDYCLLWQPKDIVGGDIYFMEEFDDGNTLLVMMMDCTGHGVAGAFVTMLVKAVERQIIATIRHQHERISPAKILGIFNQSIKHLLNQHDATAINNAGFDGAVLLYDKINARITFAGACLPLFCLQADGTLSILQGDKHSVGYKQSQTEYVFREHVLSVEQGMRFYITSDGFWDQNGGEKGFPFGKSRFIDLLKQHYQEPFADQEEIFIKTLHAYQGSEIRSDDIMLIGLKI